MAKLELDVTYSMMHTFKDYRQLTWRELEINDAYKQACGIVCGNDNEVSAIIADSDMVDIWIYDDDGDISAHWSYYDAEQGWTF